MSEIRDLGKEQIVNESASGAKASEVSGIVEVPAESSTFHGAPDQDVPMTLAAVREKLSGVKGKRYWRSIDELAGTPEFDKAVQLEFPSAAQEWVDPV